MEVAAGAMGPLIGKLGELLVGELNLEKRVKKGIESLHTELQLMHSTLLKVGEVPPDQLDMEVRIWAGKVRDLSYDMEDAVDGFMVRVEEGCDREPTNLKNRVKKLRKKTTRLFTKGKALHQISDKIQEAQDLSKELAKLHNRYKLEKLDTNAGATIDPRLRAVYKDVTDLVGIDHTRDELIKMLIEGDERSSQQLKTVSIVGFGGLGKTTLAKAVYDKIKVQYFDCGAFVPVSRNPDMKKILKDMLYELDKEKFKDIHNTTRDERLLLDELQDFLENKRYLIVIDDIWDEISWEFIKCAFYKNSLGSRLITTTRNVSVSEACRSSGDDIIYKLKPLSEDDSKRLFFKRIFPHRNGCPHEFEQVSSEILKKCGGVPLAIITIASSLVSNESVKTMDQWYILLKSIGRGLGEGARVEEMQKIISFSYYNMPSHLRTCLLYLSMFPEDYKIERRRLIWMWIAEGFIHHEKQNTSLFEVGESYFNELVNRSMIMPVNIDGEDKAHACRVHDMVLDLICSLSSKENFVTILDGVRRSTYGLQSKVRRLSLQNTGMTKLNTPQLGTMSMSQVRSVSLFKPGVHLMPSLSWFEFLRVLDLEGSYVGRRQDKIDLRYLGNLLHLRYLGLRRTGFAHLPSEIGKLQFLQTLDIAENSIKELPSSVLRLRQLMCLSVDDDTKVPAGLGNLLSLQELSVLDVGLFSQDDFKELSNLTELRVLLIVSWGELNESKGKALVKSIGNMHKLQILIYGGSELINFMPVGWVAPPQLRIFNTEGNWFLTLPKWINPSSLPLLSNLQISIDEARWEDIRILGKLPALRVLVLRVDGSMEGRAVERGLGKLPALRDLVLRVDGSMEERAVERGFVVTADAFPCLRDCRFLGFMTVPSMFPLGAMPMLRSFHFHLRPCDVANGGLDLGMGHLPSLEKVKVNIWHIWRKEASDEEVEEVEAAVRDAADAHPNRPTLETSLYAWHVGQRSRPKP